MSKKIAVNLNDVVDNVVSNNVNVQAANDAVVEATNIKDDTAVIRDETTSIKTATESIKNDTSSIRDDALTIRNEVLDTEASVRLLYNGTKAYRDDALNVKFDVIEAKKSVDVSVSEVNTSKAEVIVAKEDTLGYRTFTKDLVEDINKRFLGLKEVDPGVTYNGDPVPEGCVYWNTNEKRWKVFNGTSWDIATTADGTLDASKNLSDLADFEEARSNLDVESVSQLDDRDTANRDRANHTGTQSLDTIDETDTKKILTSDERDKLASVEQGANVNVKADWNESDDTLDSYIINKPNVVDSLDSDSSTDILSAKQGKELKTLVDGKLNSDVVIDEDDMVSNDDTKIPTQQSVKFYVDKVVNDAIASEMSYKGGYDADTNTPNLDDTDPVEIAKGDMYTVTADGQLFDTDVFTGDVLIAETDNPTDDNGWTIVAKQHDVVASNVAIDSNGNLTSSNVQDGLVELQSDIDTINSDDTVEGSIDYKIKTKVLDDLDENIRDTIGLTLTNGDNVTITVDDDNDTITISSVDTTYEVKDGELSEINFTSTMRDKLDGIEDNANNYSHPTGDGYEHIPSKADTNENDVLSIDADGNAVWKSPEEASTDAEAVRDIIGDALVAGDNVGIVVDDDNDTITISSSHEAISAASSSDNSGRVYIQDILLDSNGHVTGIATAEETVTDTWRDVIDNLTSTDTDKSLTANQGKILKDELDGKASLDSISTLYNDDTSFTIDDHTITIKRGDGSTLSIDVPDNDTTYAVGDGGLTEINFTQARSDKLDGIEDNANNYVHPTGDGNEHVPASSSSTEGYVLTLDSDLNPQWSEASSGGEDNVQVDWNESDTASDAYIKNKPNVERNIAALGTATLVRYDKVLSSTDIIEMVYNSDDLLTTIRYTNDDPDNDIYYRDELSYDSDENLVEVKHYYNTDNLDTASGTTSLTYTDGSLTSTSYTE